MSMQISSDSFMGVNFNCIHSHDAGLGVLGKVVISYITIYSNVGSEVSP